MARFHLPAESWAGEAVLAGDEAKHASQVLRLRRGDRVEVFDGRGRSASAEILGVSKSELHLRLGETRFFPPPEPRVTLAQAVTKGKSMDWIVQKAVELGVNEIQPLLTRHAVVQVGEDDADRKSGKWRRTVLEACKQCGGNHLPEVLPLCAYDPWIGTVGGELKLIASLAPGSKPMREVLRGHPEPRRVVILIGPEGDFSQVETSRALEAGFLPVSLGGTVLRAETAALAAVAALRYEYPSSPAGCVEKLD